MCARRVSTRPPPAPSDYERLCRAIGSDHALNILRLAASDDEGPRVVAAVLGQKYPTLSDADEIQRLIRQNL